MVPTFAEVAANTILGFSDGLDCLLQGQFLSLQRLQLNRSTISKLLKLLVLLPVDLSTLILDVLLKTEHHLSLIQLSSDGLTLHLESVDEFLLVLLALSVVSVISL